MKATNTLVVASMIALALSACVAREEQLAVPTNNPNVELVSKTPSGSSVYRHCIKNVSYLTLSSNSIIAELDTDGRPRECREK